MREQFSFSKISPLFVLGLFAAGFFAMSVFLGGVFPLMKARAAAGDNVTGWVWSDTIGWISMNNTTDGSPNAYGVHINFDNTLSGWAWSDNIGWICFGATCVNEGLTPAPDGMPTWASVNPTSGEVGGWAKIVSITDATGWIALRNSGADIDSSGFTYGPKVALADGQDGQNVSRGDWYWWGWSDAIGWMDFGSQVGGNHAGVKTSWIPTPPTPVTITPQGGVFEPLCCNAGADTGAVCLGAYNAQTGAGDVYCDDLSGRINEDLKGTHLHTFHIDLANLPVSSGTARCTVELPGRCPDVSGGIGKPFIPGPLCFPSFDSACPGQCGNGSGSRSVSTSAIASNGTATLSYTVSEGDVFQGITENAFWLLNACEYEQAGTTTPLNIVKQPIYTHPNTWDIASSTGLKDQYRARACYRGGKGQYFSNTVQCTDAGDFGFAGLQALGRNVEVECEDICTYGDANDSILDCGEAGWKSGTACCTPEGAVDNDGNSEPSRNLYFANESEPYCEGIIQPRVYEQVSGNGGIVCDPNSGESANNCDNVILGVCDVYADEAQGVTNDTTGLGYCVSEPFLTSPTP